MKHAIALAAAVVLLVFFVQKLDARKSDRLGGSDTKAHWLSRSDTHVAEVNLGQWEIKPDPNQQLKEDFPALFETKGQIVAFTATWCGPCGRQKTQYRALEGRFNVLIYDIDEEQGRKLFEHFEGSAVPTTLIVVNGEEQKRWEGYTSATEIEQFAVDARKDKKDDQQTRRIEIGPFRIDWSSGVQIYIRSTPTGRSAIQRWFPARPKKAAPTRGYQLAGACEILGSSHVDQDLRV